MALPANALAKDLCRKLFRQGILRDGVNSHEVLRVVRDCVAATPYRFYSEREVQRIVHALQRDVVVVVPTAAAADDGGNPVMETCGDDGAKSKRAGRTRQRRPKGAVPAVRVRGKRSRHPKCDPEISQPIVIA